MVFAEYVMRFDSYILFHFLGNTLKATYIPNIFDIGLRSKINPRNIKVYNLVAVADDQTFT